MLVNHQEKFVDEFAVKHFDLIEEDLILRFQFYFQEF
jgi:hypothetical protein